MFRNLSMFGLPLSGRPSELIELALSFGFDSMDMDLIDFKHQSDAFSVTHARRLMVSARLSNGVFMLPVAWEADDEIFNRDLETLASQLDVAASADALRAVATVSPACNERAFKDNFEFHCGRLETLGNLLASRSIKLGLAIVPEAEARANKQHEFVHSLDKLIALVGSAHQSVGIVVDVWGMHIAGHLADMISQIPTGRIVDVRLSDAPQDVPSETLTHAQRLMPGETGVIDTASILKALEAVGYDGPVTPWADRSTLAGRGREKIVKLSGDRLESAWKAADLPIVERWFAPAQK